MSRAAMYRPRVLGRTVTRALAAAVLGAAALLPATAQAPGDFRVALVIGNGGYPGDWKLVNPQHDADAMSRTLRSLGFSVIDVRDGSRPAMAQALARAAEALKGRRAIGMLYYAGHGVQLDWRNYMIPVNARLASATDLPSQALDVGSVIDAFKGAGNRINIVVLDACRENPFKGSGSRGLAPLDAPPGTFLAYATAPGNVADDGDAAGGLYTRFLVQELQRPGARIEDVFKRVRIQVRQTSNGRQIPWESTSLEDDFSFSDARAARAEDLERMAAEARRREQELLDQAAKARERERQLVAELERERQAAAAREDERRRIEAEAAAREQARLAAAERARSEQEARDRKEALAREAATAREKERQIAEQLERERRQQAAAAEEARRVEARRIALASQPALPVDSRIKISASTASDPAFRAQREEWERVKDTGTAQDLYAYLLKYPSGVFAEQVQIRLDGLARPAIEAQQPAEGVLRTVPGVRFRVGDTFTYNVRSFYGREWRGVVKIARIDGDRVVDSSGSISDLLGNYSTISDGEKRSAPLVKVPPELTVGKRWDSAYERLPSRKTVTYSFKVLGVEKITVPAGEFLAYKIEGVGYEFPFIVGTSWTGFRRHDGTYWLDGRTHLLLKEEWRSYETLGVRLPDGYTRELASVRRAQD